MYDKKRLKLKTGTSTVENSKVKSTTNKSDSRKDEIKKSNLDVKQLNEQLKTVSKELSNENCNISLLFALMNSV